MNAPNPRIGLVSLGCAKALSDSERILSRLRAEGYALSPDYEGADAVIVNTCGFLDSARAESLDAIGEALAENGKVIVTGCLGAEPDVIRGAYPNVTAVTGPHKFDAVMTAVREAVPPAHAPFENLVPSQGVRLTPRHFAYLKISEGCDNACKFCIIPKLRGGLVSRTIDDVMREAEALVAAGVRELLVISQDTSAYGRDIRYAPAEWRGAMRDSRFQSLCEALGELGVWVRLHYVYPYPHVDNVIPLMADGKITPYLDIPFQHGSPRVLKAMRRPADHEKTLSRIASWRATCPDLAIRSTFIVGYPGETEAEFQELLDWLSEAQIDRVGCFKYEPVPGATSNDLPDHVADDVKQDRYDRLMAHQQAISAERMAAKVGRTLRVLVDEVDADGAIARSTADAPDIDGQVFIDDGQDLSPGEFVDVLIDEAAEYDLWGRRA